ncbi:MAG: cell surface protein SprA [Bacteroidetes bacterium]|nr:cell surface protein SprA [Bacteroidota bacterium]
MSKSSLLLVALLSLIGICAQASDSFGGANLGDPYDQSWVVSTDTIPLEDRYNDFVTDPGANPFDLQDPGIIEQSVEYDPETGTYLIEERIGDDFYRMPTYMTFEEYLDYKAQQEEQAYFGQLSGLGSDDIGASGRVDPMKRIDVDNSLVDRLFGGTDVEIRPQGNIDLTFGVDYQNVENPALTERQRRNGGFDFDMAIQMNVEGQIGEKLKLSTNYNTQATFDFDNQIKLNYDTDAFSEDEIIKKIEAGNVSLPLRNSLIQGSQSLFGIKTELQFGRLWITAIASQQRSENERLTIEGGSQVQEFEVKADEYDENRHFFLSHYNRDVFESSLENLPQIRGLFKLQKVEVWITNDRNENEEIKDIVALADLGEPERNRMTTDNPGLQPPVIPKYQDIYMENALPDNNANPIFQELFDNPRARKSDQVSSVLKGAPFNFQQSIDFEKVSSARKLNPNEFTFHPQLGFISINVNVQPDQVLGVAYQYSYRDSIYQVGQFSDDVPTAGDSLADSRVLFVKMLKSTTQRVDVPAWDLMMKNVYSIGAFQVTQQDFRLDIFYEDPGAGQKRFLPDTDLKGIPLLNVFNLDNLNTQGDPQRDGVFDFVPGVTINPSNGRIMFPVLEPFGSSLAGQIESPLDSARYVYQQLYDSTKTRAREAAYLNRYVIRGEYKSSVSSEISLGAFNLPPGSVRVSAGGQQLTEGVDYEIDYNIGRVKILNDALLASAVPINIDFEDNTIFGFQTKSMIGVRGEFRFNPNFTIGGTYLHLFERPFTPKVNIGDDPINNRIYGLDVNYSTEAPFLTRMVDAIPLIETKEKSTFSVLAETAFLKPGHARAINEDDDEENGGVVYIDDFEGSVSAIPLHSQPNRWKLASVPQNDLNNNNPMFPEVEVENSVVPGVNRALLNWYRMDPGVGGPNQNNPYTTQISWQEIFENFSNQNVPQFGGAGVDPFLNTVPGLNLSYYPDERGPYNFDPPSGTAFSAGLSTNGGLLEPETRWAGIMRDITTNDFQAANVEFVEFWLLSPFLDTLGNASSNPMDHEGTVYLELGNISEDILKDGRKFFENGLPGPETMDPEQTYVETQWGRVPVVQQVTNSFDANPDVRQQQDIGFDGLSDEEEEIFYSDWLSLVQGHVTNPDRLAEILADPSNDNYVYYNDANVYGQNDNALVRYRAFNGSEGNTPAASEDSNVNTFGSNFPDIEDLNDDRTTNETEAYFQYRIPIEFDGDDGIDLGSEFVVERVDVEGTNRAWYRFKVPLDLPATHPNFKKVGGIQDFRSIGFIRMYLKDFKDETHLRFARLDLVRNQWRRYILPSGATDIGGPQEEGDVLFDVSDVNIEENASKEPFNYDLPPGITREQAFGVNQLAQQNESAMVMNVCNLGDGDERAIYKLTSLDLRLYEGLKMFVHGERKPDDPSLQDGDLTVFIRIGSDFSRNYYEYEMPLTLSDPDNSLNYGDPGHNRIVWPVENDMEVMFQIFKDLKIMRNNGGIDPGSIYPLNGFEDPTRPGSFVRIKGNPNLGEVKGVMVGIRNPKDDNAPHCAEVWVNEMRVFGLDERGGMAALARVDMQLADFGNLSLAGNYSTVGFGALDQQLIERSREEILSLDLATDFQLGKFFPEQWNLSIPFYYQLSQETRTPQFDPYDLDLTLDEKLEAADAANRDSIRTIAQDVTTIESFNFTNVRKGRSAQATGKPMPWSIENFSLSYAQSEINHRDPIIESDNLRTYRGIVDYGYSRGAKYIKPFDKIVKGGAAKYLKFLKEFNFNPLPNSFGFSTVMDRQISTTSYRFTDGDPLYTTFFNKRWTWDRSYSLTWDFARSLKFNFDAINTAVIDEPEGLIDNDAKRAEIWERIQGFGRNKSYNHNFGITYTLPFKYFPGLDFINVRANYNAGYSWTAAALNVQSLGNVIQNNQSRSLNGDLDFVKLYNKSKFLKKLNGTSRPSPSRGGSRGGRPGADQPARGNDDDRERGDKEPGIAAKLFIRPLLMIRKFRGTYSETFGTVLPGYLPDTEYLGLTDRFTSPGWQFVAGLQPNIRTEDYYTDQDFLYNNWQWVTGDLLLNQSVTQNYTQDIDARLTLEPFNDFRIELDATRSYSRFHTEDFRRNEITVSVEDRLQEEYEHLNVRDFGSYSITYFAMNTLFSDDLIGLFNTFENNRVVIANRLSDGMHADTTQALEGYPSKYGRAQQSVLIPSFLAAYTDQDPSTVEVNEDYTEVLFNTLPAVNWQVDYSGLEKLPLFKEIFQRFSIAHGYRSMLTVNTYQTELLFDQDAPASENINPNTQDVYSRFEIPDITISENFSPLIGVDMRLQNDVSLNVDFKKSRNLQLSFIDNALNETKVSEYVIGFGWRLSNVDIPFLTGSKRRRGRGITDTDLSPASGAGRGARGPGLNQREPQQMDITFDFSLRDDVTYRYLLDQSQEPIPTRGTRSITISPAVEYQLSKQLALRFFFDYRRTEPKSTQSYPITNVNGGITVRFILQ